MAMCFIFLVIFFVSAGHCCLAISSAVQRLPFFTGNVIQSSKTVRTCNIVSGRCLRCLPHQHVRKGFISPTSQWFFTFDSCWLSGNLSTTVLFHVHFPKMQLCFLCITKITFTEMLIVTFLVLSKRGGLRGDKFYQSGTTWFAQREKQVYTQLHFKLHIFFQWNLFSAFCSSSTNIQNTCCLTCFYEGCPSAIFRFKCTYFKYISPKKILVNCLKILLKVPESCS